MERHTPICSQYTSGYCSQNGYTYFGMLFAVMLIGLALSCASLVWQIQRQREQERELIFIGQQYIDAIASYYHAAPGGVKKYPRSLTDLLRDKRYLTVKRHLRKPWQDPFTHSNTWGLVRTQQGGIAGVYSLAPGRPVKQAGFGTLDTLLAGKSSYREWKFVYIAAMANEAPKESSVPQETTQETNPTQEEDQSQDDREQEETGEELMTSLGIRLTQ